MCNHIRDTVHLRLVVRLRLAKSVKIADAELQRKREIRPHDGSQLLGVATEDDIRPPVRHGFDWDHSLRLRSLTGFINKNMCKMTPRNPNIIWDTGRYAC